MSVANEPLPLANSDTEFVESRPGTTWGQWLASLSKIPVRIVRSARKVDTPVSTRMTREGLQVAFMTSFVLLGAVLRDVNLLIILAGTLLGMLLIQWRVCAKTLYGLTVHRRLPRAIHARKPFEVEIKVTNPKRWLGSWLVLLQEQIVKAKAHSSAPLSSQGIQLLYSSIPPTATRRHRYRCVVDRRGLYRFAGAELSTRFPMGLMRGILTAKGDETFVAQPTLGRLLPSWNELFEVRQSSARQRRTKSLSDEGAFFGLRAYRHGDSPRWIHWRSSARRAELMVKQFQQEDSHEYVILLDLHRAKNEKEVADTVLNIEDLAVEFVSTLVQQIANSNVGIITVAIGDASPELANRIQSRTQASGLLDRLAIADGATGNEIFEAMRQLEREHRHVDNLLVVSTRPRINLVPNEQANDVQARDIIVFWKTLQWLNVAGGELQGYFSRVD